MNTQTFDKRIRALFANVERQRSDMHDYQAIEAYAFLRANPFCALFVDMGLGKTISTLTVAVDLLSEFLSEKVLVIGPLKVATDTWPTEIGLWEHTAPFRYTLIREDDDDPRLIAARAAAREKTRASGASSAQVAKAGAVAETAMRETIRRQKAMSRNPIHIVNRERVEWLVNLHGRNWPYDTVIIDESSGFKDHRSVRFKALKKVRQTAGLIRRLHELTATPATEGYEGLFAQMYLLDLGERLGKSIARYREKYFTYNKWSRKYKLRPDAEEEILSKIADICKVMKAEDYLDLRDPLVIPRYVRLADTQIRLIEKMKTDFIVNLPNGAQIEAQTAAAMASKLLQMSSGVLYETYLDEDRDTGDMKKVKRVHHLHDHKIETLRQIVDELQGETVLVAYHFKSSLDRLEKAFPKAVTMDKEGKCIKAWNAGKIPMLLVHPQSAGHGLNLQAGGHNIVLFDMIWSLELFLQLIGRLARQGQKHLVRVHPLIAKGTIDETVFSGLTQKADIQEKLFELLKRLAKQVLSRKAVKKEK